MLTWVIDQHVDRVKGVKTPIVERYVEHGCKGPFIDLITNQ